MNLFRAIIDTRHQNAVVANINQFDDATLELQILSDGQALEPWIDPKFRLLGIKKDGNEVEQSDNIELINANDHIIQIKLKEQMVTCRGMVKMQLIITEGDRTSTSIFYLSIAQSLENKIIESHRDVKTLDELEAYIAQGREVIFESEKIATNLKNEMSEFNQEAKSSESDRQANELNRASKELIRIDNEEDRVANETERVANEEIRVENEEDRVANEQDRVVNETNRRIAENTRNAQERARQEAELQRNAIFEENENLRKENEKGRIANENDRNKKFAAWEERETTRLKSEENRILQEQDRVESEEQREQNEATRQQQESHRQQTYNQFNESESTRQANEVERQKAEQQRAQAESTRNETFNQSQDDRNRQYAEAEETRNNAFEQNEANRQLEYTQAERDRVESEELRKARERDRENAESQRAQAESNRDAAESQRIENFNTAIANANSTMNQAVTNVNQAIEESNATMIDIENRADACIPIIEQSADEITGARVDYTGTTHDSLRQANDANVEYVLGEVNTMHYEGQHITAHNSLAGQAKNAVIEGQTLVNCLTNEYRYCKLPTSHDVIIDSSDKTYDSPTYRIKEILTQFTLKANTEYLFAVNVKSMENTSTISALVGDGSADSFPSALRLGKLGWNLIKYTPTTSIVKIGYYLEQNSDKRAVISQPMVIEYQEGMENWDIPYFEGIKSVKTPMLRYFNKNIIPQKKQMWYACRFKAGTSFKLTTKDGNTSNGGNIVFKDENNNKIWFSIDSGKKQASITLKQDVFYINNQLVEGVEYQLEISLVATKYEIPKSNSITTPDDLTLRGIGDVKDTLDIAKGEKVERIVERVLNGSENWQNNEFFSNTLSEFRLNLKTKIKGIITDRFIQGGAEERVAFLEDGDLYIRVLKTKLSSDTVEGFKKWLANNNLTIQYVLAEPITTKIDLSDNHVYSYQGTTHYSFEVPEGSLIPTLSIDVPTDLPAVVTRQRATIENQKEQIITLEQENEQLIAQNEVQDIDISLNQDAINFMLFAPATMSVNDESKNSKGANTMAAYLANQILKGKLDYVLVVSRYGSYKEDIDTILIAEGKQDLIK